jgi:hypothetical protein
MLPQFFIHYLVWPENSQYFGVFPILITLSWLQKTFINPLSPELITIFYLLALLAHDFLHVSRIRVKLLTLRLLMSHMYIYIYDISNLRVKLVSVLVDTNT